MSGQTNVTTTPPVNCGTQPAKQHNVSSQVAGNQENHGAEELKFEKLIDHEPSKNESVESNIEVPTSAEPVQEILGGAKTLDEDVDAASMSAGNIVVQSIGATPGRNPTASDGVVQSFGEVSTENTQPSLEKIPEDLKVPDEILSLIHGKSPNEVVHIINGQLAELKAVETLRDVEEECLDELTNEIIAKITKESII